jgi:DNA-binding PadR family transcriptional regulator
MRYVKYGKKSEWVCENFDSISFTYIEANKKHGITKSRFSRAIDDLLAKGFITIKHKGGGYQHDKSVYALSDQWRLWRPDIVFEERKKESVQRGFCKPKRENATSKIVPIHGHEIEPQKMVLQQ